MRWSGVRWPSTRPEDLASGQKEHYKEEQGDPVTTSAVRVFIWRSSSGQPLGCKILIPEENKAFARDAGFLNLVAHGADVARAVPYCAFSEAPQAPAWPQDMLPGRLQPGWPCHAAANSSCASMHMALIRAQEPESGAVHEGW